MDVGKILLWGSRGIAVLATISFVLLLFSSQMAEFPIAGKFLASIIIIACMFIAFVNEPIGGAIFVIASSVIFIAVINDGLPQLFMISTINFFLTGALFLVKHMYEEKKHKSGGDEF